MSDVLFDSPLVRNRAPFRNDWPTEGWTRGLEVVLAFFRLGDVQQLVVGTAGQVDLDASLGSVPAFQPVKPTMFIGHGRMSQCRCNSPLVVQLLRIILLRTRSDICSSIPLGKCAEMMARRDQHRLGYTSTD